MEEVKVSELPNATDVNDNDLMMIVQGGYNKKVSKAIFDEEIEEEISDLVSKTTIKTKTLSGTTNNYGTIPLGLNASNAMVLGVVCTGGYGLPWIYNDGDWYAYITGTTSSTNTLNVNKNVSVNGTVYYLER